MEQLLTLNEVAEVLKVSRRTVTNLIAARELPTVRLNSKIVRVDSHALQKFLASKATKK